MSPMSDSDVQAFALAGSILSQNLFLFLQHKGILTKEEGKDLLDSSLAFLECFQADFAQAKEQHESACALLASLRSATYGAIANWTMTDGGD